MAKENILEKDFLKVWKHLGKIGEKVGIDFWIKLFFKEIEGFAHAGLSLSSA
mgnify:CR=1 FL=1